jgi:hypothetical protein
MATSGLSSPPASAAVAAPAAATPAMTIVAAVPMTIFVRRFMTVLLSNGSVSYRRWFPSSLNGR